MIELQLNVFVINDDSNSVTHTLYLYVWSCDTSIGSSTCICSHTQDRGTSSPPGGSSCDTIME